jgi:hypothetical protein
MKKKPRRSVALSIDSCRDLVAVWRPIVGTNDFPIALRALFTLLHGVL